MQKYQWLVFIALIGWTVSFASCNKTHKVEGPVASKEMVKQKPSDVIPVEPIDRPADVLIYIGKTLWISPENAENEAEMTEFLLESENIQVEITKSKEAVRDWMLQTTANGVVNVCILYGVLPSTIYPSGNAQPDGSVAENWIETTDGDTILNHADYFGYNSSEGTANERGAMQNLMDLPEIEINVYEHNIDMFVTVEGSRLAPSMVHFRSDRPFPLDQLEDEWFAEKILASDTGNTQATLADPIIVRDGDRGRLAIVFHTLYKNNPKAEVAAQIINYLLTQ
ncbi:hypothetical protein C6501_09355 [Candidatus Poribacteria bacterium]|nr:MAG: hypothetical protein C6501_09355 [Candidatus Poribacteria bacterium]